MRLPGKSLPGLRGLYPRRPVAREGCLYRFRDLRKEEDDFGFGRGEEKLSPPKQLASVLREGAGLGVHTVAWCDTHNNLTRCLDRQALREFEMRVLFQMSAT